MCFANDVGFWVGLGIAITRLLSILGTEFFVVTNKRRSSRQIILWQHTSFTSMILSMVGSLFIWFLFWYYFQFDRNANSIHFCRHSMIYSLIICSMKYDNDLLGVWIDVMFFFLLQPSFTYVINSTAFICIGSRWLYGPLIPICICQIHLFILLFTHIAHIIAPLLLSIRETPNLWCLTIWWMCYI